MSLYSPPCCTTSETCPELLYSTVLHTPLCSGTRVLACHAATVQGAPNKPVERKPCLSRRARMLTHRTPKPY